MASISVDRRYGTLSIRFRYGDRYYKRALGTTSNREARTVLSRVEDIIVLLKRGRIAMPPNVDPGDFIMADGKVEAAVPVTGQMSLKQMFGNYYDLLPEGAKEKSTVYGESIHRKHLLRHLGSRKAVRAITKADLQAYIARRTKDKWRGKNIRPETIKKEITTLRLVWNWSHEQQLVSTPPPTKGLVYPKTDEKYPFMTREEIERYVAGLDNEDEIKKYWESLYLSTEEISDVLRVVKKVATYEYVYPMVTIAAHTGARRSEIMRSRREDVDFHNGVIMFREKKGSKKNAMTFRRVEMSTLLTETLREWFSSPAAGLTFTISLRSSPTWAHQPVSLDAAQNNSNKHLRRQGGIRFEASTFSDIRWHQTSHQRAWMRGL
jgi:integrase